MTDNVFRLILPEPMPRLRVVEPEMPEHERQERIAHAARCIEDGTRTLMRLLPPHEVRAMNLEPLAQTWATFAAIHEVMADLAGNDDDPAA